MAKPSPKRPQAGSEFVTTYLLALATMQAVVGFDPMWAARCPSGAQSECHEWRWSSDLRHSEHRLSRAKACFGPTSARANRKGHQHDHVGDQEHDAEVIDVADRGQGQDGAKPIQSVQPRAKGSPST